MRNVCSSRLFPWMGHSYERRLWDKFGTGIKNVAYYRCLHCGKEKCR